MVANSAGVGHPSADVCPPGAVDGESTLWCTRVPMTFGKSKAHTSPCRRLIAAMAQAGRMARLGAWEDGRGKAHLSDVVATSIHGRPDRATATQLHRTFVAPMAAEPMREKIRECDAEAQRNEQHDDQSAPMGRWIYCRWRGGPQETVAMRIVASVTSTSPNGPA